MLTESDFDKKYTYDANVYSTERNETGVLETYGHDLVQVKQILKDRPDHVWTLLDGDDGTYIVSGYHFVNRIYYIITNEPCQSDHEEYLVDSFG